MQGEQVPRGQKDSVGKRSFSSRARSRGAARGQNFLTDISNWACNQDGSIAPIRLISAAMPFTAPRISPGSWRPSAPPRAFSSSSNNNSHGTSNGSSAPPLSNTTANGKPLAPWALTFDLRERETLWTEVLAWDFACVRLAWELGVLPAHAVCCICWAPPSLCLAQTGAPPRPSPSCHPPAS